MQKANKTSKFLPRAKTFFLLLPAPETQHKGVCSISSDMFSLGMLMISVFCGGQSIIQANNSTNTYFKQAGVVSITMSTQ